MTKIQKKERKKQLKKQLTFDNIRNNNIAKYS